MIKIGDKAKDRISGFSGIVVARTEWLNGCVRITIAAQKLKEDGSVIDNETFDVQQVDLVEDMGPSKTDTMEKRPGGPQKDPKQW